MSDTRQKFLKTFFVTRYCTILKYRSHCSHSKFLSKIFINMYNVVAVAYTGFLKGGGRGAGNLKIMKNKRKISPLRISPFSCPKLVEDQNKNKKRSSLKISPIFGPKLREDQKKKQVFTQIRSFYVLKLSAQVTKVGAHAAILHTILC